MKDVMKKKLNPFVQEYRRINSKPKLFWSIECFMYITNFCGTRNINSNAHRVLFFLLNFQEKQEVRTKSGAFKIIFRRRCALNN